MRTPLLLLLVLACNPGKTGAGADSTPSGDGGAAEADSGAPTDSGEDGGDGGEDDGGSADGGTSGDGGDTGDGGDGGALDLVWEDVSPSDGPVGCMGQLYRASTTAISEGGLALVDVELPAGRGFQVVARAADPSDQPLFYRADGPDGTVAVTADDWWSETELLSTGFWPLGEVGAFNWPIRQEDAPFEGGRWQLYLGVVDSSGNWADGAALSVDVYVNDDDDLDEACLYARVVTATGVVADVGEARLGDAVTRWEEVYAAVGITLIATRETSGLSARLPQPAIGDTTYETLSGGGAPHQLVVVIGESVDGSGTTLGQSGGIPGPLTAGPRTAVAASWLLHAGSDGSLSEAEAGYLGETLAHEAGHYLGLFHPIDFNADYSVGWTDALDDTSTCSGGFEACGAVLGENLMFPYAWCLSGGDCTAQDDLSVDQAAVLQRSAGVL